MAVPCWNEAVTEPIDLRPVRPERLLMGPRAGGRLLVLLVSASAMALSCLAVPPNPFTTRNMERSDDWTCGYLTPAEFAGKTHGWVEPQGFIRRLKP